MTVIGSLMVNIGANIDGLRQGLGRSREMVNGARSSFSGLGSTLAGGLATGATVAASAIAGIGVALGGAAIVAGTFAADVSQGQREIQAALRTTAQYSERLGNIGLEVWKNNYAGSVTEAGLAVAEIRQQLGALSDNELQQATESAFKLQETFGVDLVQSTNAAAVLMENFGLNQAQAFDLITTGFQQGLNSSDDFLDSIREYGGLFAQNGVDADQMFSIMQSGLQGGVLGVDKVSDLWKEFGIRMRETGQFSGDLTTDFERVRAELSQMSGEAQDLAAKEFFGTMWEDLGADVVLGLSTAGIALGEMAGATDSLNVRFNSLGQMWESVKRRALAATLPLGERLLELANSIMPQVQFAFDWLEVNLPPMVAQAVVLFDNLIGFISSTVTPYIQEVLIPAFKDFGDWFINEGWPQIQAFIAPIIAEVIPGLQLLGEMAMNLGAVVLPILSQWWAILGNNLDIILPILGAITLAIIAINAPIVLVIGAVVLLAAAWANNWGGIQDKTQAVIDFITPYITVAINTISEVITNVVNYLNAWWAAHGDNLMLIIRTVWDFIVASVQTQIIIMQNIITTVTNAIAAFWDEWGSTIMTVTQLAWDNIVTIVTGAMDMLGFIIDAAAALIRGDWEAFGDALGNIWSTAWGVIFDLAQNMTAQTIAIVANFVRIIKDNHWTPFINSLKTTWENLWNGLKNTIDGAATTISETISGLLQSIQDIIDKINLIPKIPGISNQELRASVAAPNGGTLAGNIEDRTPQAQTINNFYQTNIGGTSSADQDFLSLKARAALQF